jgi:TM2 domain-containing membrane protein YozV
MNDETVEHPEDSAEPVVAANSKPRAYAPYTPVELSDRQRSVFIALGIFFGALGVHNFYARRTLAGVIQLGLTVTLFWTFVVPLGVGLFALIECLTTRCDGNGRWLR